jgi:predicted O-methyltransferase YrrM
MRYEEILEYVGKLVGEGDALLARVDKKSDELREEGVHQVDPSTGKLLELLARLGQAKSVLEIGSGAGYSALWLMKGVKPSGVLDAIDVNPKVVQALEDTVNSAGLQDRIKIHKGHALDVLSAMSGSYDIVFIDADKDEYPEYLREALRLTRPGSVILAHNMFMSIAGGRGEKAPRIGGIAEYTRQIFSDHRLSSIIIPVGDGLALSYRTG